MHRLRALVSFVQRRGATTMASINLPTRKLNTGADFPLIGYGTGTALFKRDNLDQIDRTTVGYIDTAIKLGFTHLDGAELYNTEPELGAAIRESGLPRSSLFVTTKVINTISDIPKAIDQSLSKLGLDYVDLYLIHSPWFTKDQSNPKAELQAAWKEMEKIQRAGKAKAIGVSNFIIEQLEMVLETAEIVPAVNQVEFHPYLQRGDLVPWSESKGIATAAFGPLTSIVKGKPGPTDEVVAKLAKKYGVSEEAVALRWCIDQGVAAITTSSKQSRLKDYLKVLDFELTKAEIKEISDKGNEKHLRTNNFMHQWDPQDRR